MKKNLLVFLGLLPLLSAVSVHASQSMIAPSGYVPYNQNVSVTFTFTEPDWDQAALNFNPNNQTCIDRGGSYWSIEIGEAVSKTRISQHFPLNQQSGTVVFDGWTIGEHWSSAYSNCYNSNGNLLARMGSFPIDFTIVDPAVPIISTTNLPSATASTFYSQSILVSGGSAPYNWGLSNNFWSIEIGEAVSKTRISQHFPLNQQSGTVVFDGWTIGEHWSSAYSNCYNSNGNLLARMGSFPIDFTIVDLNVSPSPTPSPTPSSGPSMTTNPSGYVPYNQNVSVTFTFTEPDWDQAALNFNPNNQLCMPGGGSLPSGLLLNNLTGEISGTPTITGSYSFIIKVMDNGGRTATRNFTLVVNPMPAPVITTTLLLDATVANAYSQLLNVSDGMGPFNWSIISGGLPIGLSLNSSTGGISGTPTTVQTSNFTAQVTDVNNQTATKALSITVHGNTPTGSNVSVGPLSGATLTFGQVTQEGQTTVITSTSGMPPPSGFKFGNPPTYYSFSTTASYTAPITVCISWTQGQFNNENNLKLFHFDGTNWVNVTTSIDTVNNVICGQSNSFSDFAIFEKKQVVATIDIKPESYPNSINLGSNGTVAVAIFSTPTFDATAIVPLTVTLASAPVKLKGNGTAMHSFQDVNNDGLLDLIVHVSTEALQLSETDELTDLVGYTSDITEVIGSDTVRVVP